MNRYTTDSYYIHFVLSTLFCAAICYLYMCLWFTQRGLTILNKAYPRDMHTLFGVRRLVMVILLCAHILQIRFIGIGTSGLPWEIWVRKHILWPTVHIHYVVRLSLYNKFVLDCAYISRCIGWRIGIGPVQGPVQISRETLNVKGEPYTQHSDNQINAKYREIGYVTLVKYAMIFPTNTTRYAHGLSLFIFFCL